MSIQHAPPARSVRTAWRTAVLVTLWVIVAPVAAWILLLFDGTGGFNGWKYTLPGFLPLALLTWWLTRKLRGNRRWLALSAAGWLLFGLGLPAIATPNDERLLAAASGIPAPPASELLGYDLRGSYWCLQGCPQRWMYYAVSDTKAATDWVNGWARDQGWRQASLDVGGVGNGWCKGDFSLIVLRGSGMGLPQTKLHALPEGADQILVRIGANCR